VIIAFPVDPVENISGFGINRAIVP